MATDVDKILEKLDEMKEQRYENGLAAKELEGRMGFTEKWMEKHEEKHRDQAKHRRSINWKMWFLIIGGALYIVQDQIRVI